MGLSDWVRETGRGLGFDRVGVAPASDLPELEFFSEWLERGYAGELEYMRDPRRADVRALWPEARSVICCALAYDTHHPRSTEVPLDPERGWVSRYAWGDDYHGVVREKLEALRQALAGRAGLGFESRAYVDTGPVLERVYGKYAGLGWQAKNTCLLDAELGSFFFIGVLVTNLELEPDTPLPDGCGACTLCIEACPTGAIVEPYRLDARRCLSYLTIELRGAIPEEFRQPLGRHVFGCDICQDVCPYNRRAGLTRLAAFEPREVENRNSKIETRKSKIGAPQTPSPAAPAAGMLAKTEQQIPRPEASGLGMTIRTGHEPRGTNHESRAGETLFHPRLDWLASLTEEDFRRVFRASPLKRAKWRGLLRNTVVAMGNSGNPRFRPLLEGFADSDEPLLAEHARWALDRLADGIQSRST